MSRKEFLLFAVSALLLTNASIIGTLYLSGQLGDSEEDVAEQAETDAEEEPAADAAPDVPEPPPKPALHSMAKAIYVCESKLLENSKGKHMAYEVNSVASRFLSDTQIYQIFIDTKTATTLTAPQEWKEVTCEVAAEDLSIIGYKAMAN